MRRATSSPSSASGTASPSPRSWGAKMRAPPFRPPWWPESEPWPPENSQWRGRGQWGAGGPWSYGAPWRRHRGRFMWRFGCFFGLAIAFVTAAIALGVWLVAVALGLNAVSHPIRLFAVGALAVGFIAALFVGRAFRRFASPVGELVEAAGRIEEGDYGARVRERGPREVRTLVRAFNAMSARLEATDHERRTFVADVSHELRTPLSVIRGQVEAIAEGVYPADEEHLAPIQEATVALEQLVDDLRTLALTESGSLTLARESVDLAVLANESAASFRATADAAGVSLQVEASPDPPTVSADPARIRGVLGNLLANALRHTPAGGTVTLAVRRSEALAPGGSAGQVDVAVTDTGSGISAELLPHVFDRFVKGEGSSGSGLGLAIARDLVAAHGGAIEAQSVPGGGTTIRFWLPVG
jgi:two-component system, OmpR family, sensor histidine kinase BaeS